MSKNYGYRVNELYIFASSWPSAFTLIVPKCRSHAVPPSPRRVNVGRYVRCASLSRRLVSRDLLDLRGEHGEG
jgi:hypothetical protein